MKTQIINSEEDLSRRKPNYILGLYIAFITALMVSYSITTVIQNL